MFEKISKPRSNIFVKALYNFFSIQHRSFSSSASQVIFSGIQPTGVPHIGNYLGALKEWVRFQNEAPPASQLFFSIVDLHAITVNQTASQLKKWKSQTFAALLAIGLDPKRSTIFYQSSVRFQANQISIEC